MARVAPPDKRPLVVRNPSLLETKIGCMQHPDAVACAVIEDGETHARYHLAGFAFEMEREPKHRCGACNRADGRCEYASPRLVSALVDAGQSMEEIHEHGKRLLQCGPDAQKASER